KLDRIIPRLKREATIVEGKLSEVEAQKEGDYIVDEKARAVALTEQGIATCERLLSIDNLYDPQHITILHHIQQGLRAHALFKRDVDYVVKDGQVIIVDEFTGRLMPGRRWSDGLHQAVEAKEGVRIERENQTLATITFQNYFRMYGKLAGMTGTAETEAEEFAKIYKLDVTVVPTNRPLVRVNYPDVVYKTEREKFNAVVEDIIERTTRGQPGLPLQGDPPEEGARPGHRGVRGAGRRAGRGAPDHRAGARARRRARRAPHRRYGASRGAPGRQPAPRPQRAPGRPRLLALLPVARGRPAADLRLAAHPEDHGAPRDGGGGADRA